MSHPQKVDTNENNVHPILPVKRRRRRNFKLYRECHINNLQNALNATPALHPILQQLFFASDKSDHAQHSEALEEKPYEKTSPSLPINCPFQTPDEELIPIDGVFYFHVKSKCHLTKKIFTRDDVKEILESQCLHYARACKVALVNYSVLSDHFHMLIGIPGDCYVQARAMASKMVGCIKQQFTKRFKNWHEIVYRREKRYRCQKLSKGTLWDGRAEIEFIANKQELLSCVLYIESNHILIHAAADIRKLDSPPAQTTANKNTKDGISPNYLKILHKFCANQHHSGTWYINGSKGHKTKLSDGTDGIWLTGRELEYWWRKPVKSYPSGWRKVWFKKGGGILITTPNAKRRYPRNPAIEQLGRTSTEQGNALRQLILTTCWLSRTTVWVDRYTASEEPGMGKL